MAPPQKVLFYRNLKRNAGGHLKVWHYYNYVKQSPTYQPLIHFGPDTVWDQNNYWLHERPTSLPTWDLSQADIIFMAGFDWLLMPETFRDHPPAPIIFLVQGLRHADPQDVRFNFLRHKAIRICITPQVTQALTDTGITNGPIFTIPNGIDLSPLPKPTPRQNRPIDIFVNGYKNPELTLHVGKTLRKLHPQLNIKISSSLITRPQYLNFLAQSKTAIFIPYPQEGFYMPPLEAMHLNTLVICPNVGGNQIYSRHQQNCFFPHYQAQEIIKTASNSVKLTSTQIKKMLLLAKETPKRFTLAKEKQKFLHILDRTYQLWQD